MAWVAAVVGLVKGVVDSNNEQAARTQSENTNTMMALFRAYQNSGQVSSSTTTNDTSANTSPNDVDRARAAT